MIKTWQDIIKWYGKHGFSEAALAALDPRSDLRRFGDEKRIAQTLTWLEIGR
jgi:carboxypeptidase C (cathepsin A)